jgi:hypothetical protein
MMTPLGAVCAPANPAHPQTPDAPPRTGAKDGRSKDLRRCDLEQPRPPSRHAQTVLLQLIQIALQTARCRGCHVDGQPRLPPATPAANARRTTALRPLTSPAARERRSERVGAMSVGCGAGAASVSRPDVSVTPVPARLTAAACGRFGTRASRWAFASSGSVATARERRVPESHLSQPSRRLRCINRFRL